MGQEQPAYSAAPATPTPGPAAPETKEFGADATGPEAESSYPPRSYPAPAAQGTTASPFGTPPRYATPPPTTDTMGESAEADRRVRGLIEDFVVAEAALLASGASCFEACRALRSMQRATARLCELAGDQREQQRCELAEARYRAARERVRSVCSVCQGGPSLESDARIDDER